MAKLFQKSFFILEDETWGIEIRKRYPRKPKNQARVLDCITLEVTWLKGPKGSKFQVKSNDGWHKIYRSKSRELGKYSLESIAESAIDDWAREKEPEYHYRDEY
jgi:hypothetical protein